MPVKSPIDPWLPWSSFCAKFFCARFFTRCVERMIARFPVLVRLSYIDRIKLLIMVAMTVGHLAWAFVPTDTLWSDGLHFFARMAIPLACFLLVEGYRKSKHLLAYVGRLFGFGLLAQVPFALFVTDSIQGVLDNPSKLINYGNVLFSLGFALLALMAANAAARSQHWQEKIGFGAVITLLLLLSAWSDWPLLVVLWALAIFYYRHLGFVAVCLLAMLWSDFVPEDAPLVFNPLSFHRLMDFGVYLSVPVMSWYEQNKQRTPLQLRLPRLLFYWYYVIHLLLLWLLVQVF